MTPEEKPRPETVSGRELTVTAGPHLRQGLSVSMMMYLTLAALIFPAAAGVFFFGYYALSVIFVSIGAAVATEVLVKKLRGRPFVMDGSTVITGLLLALLMPPTIPCGWWPSGPSLPLPLSRKLSAVWDTMYSIPPWAAWPLCPSASQQR